MRILHVVPTYIPAWRYGGPIHSVHGLCRGLAKLGHYVDVATTNVNGRENSDVSLTAPVIIDGVNVHYFESRRLRRIFFSLSMWHFMRENIQKWDVIHIHSVFLWPTLAAAKLARDFKKVHIISPRGMLVNDLIARRNKLVKRVWISLVERRNIAHCSAVHVTSALEAEEIVALGLTPRRLFEVPNGIDVDWGGSAELSTLDSSFLDRPYILYLGRISWKKGLDRAIAALPMASGITLIIAGNDDEGLIATLEAQARTLGVSERVRFLGMVQGPFKQALLTHATALILPSYSENFGNVVLEALACGVPAIVTAEVGLASLVREARCGIVSEGTPNEIGSSIRTLLECKSLRRQMSENGLAAVKAYDWSSIASQMEQQYIASKN